MLLATQSANAAAESTTSTVTSAGSSTPSGPSNLSGLSESVETAETAADDDFGSLLDKDLNELLDVVVTATKKSQRIDEAPSIIEIVTAEQIRNRGYRTVGEALQAIPGIATIDDLVHFNVGVRGIYADPNSASEIIKLMINSQPVSMRSTSENAFGYDLIPIEAIQQIEIIRGPGSALYGANAFLGVINIITKKRAEAGSEHAITADTYATQNVSHAHVNGAASVFSMGKFGDVDYLAAATMTIADRSGLEIPGLADIVIEDLHKRNPNLPVAAGYPSPGFNSLVRTTYHTNPTSQNDMERAGSIYGQAGLDLHEGSRVELDVHLQYIDRFGEFQDFSALSHQNRLSWYNGYARIRYLLEPEQGLGVNAAAAIALGGAGPNERLVDPLNPTLYKERDFGYLALDGVMELSYAFSDTHNLRLGVDVTRDAENLVTLTQFDTQNGGSTMGFDYGNQSFVNIGLYLQWLWSPIEDLNLTVGSRLDHNSFVACNAGEWDCFGHLDDKVVASQFLGEGDTTVANRGVFQMSNRLAVVYKLPWLGLYTKASYGSSFKPPSPFQLYHEPWSIAWATRGDASLSPQTADTLEAQIGSGYIDGLHLTVDVFHTQVTDLIVLLKEGSESRNRNADATITGIEAAARYTSGAFSAYGNVSWILSSKVTPKRKNESEAAWASDPLNDTVPVGQYPDLASNFGFNIAAPDQHLNFNGNIRLVGTRRASLTNNKLFEERDLSKTYTLAGYVDANVTLSTLGWTPILDTETIASISLRGAPGGYVEPGVGGVDIPSPGPRIYLRLEQCF